MLAVGLSYIAFIMLRYFPSIPSFLRAFIMKWCWILSKTFSDLLMMIKWFLCTYIYYILCTCMYMYTYMFIILVWTDTREIVLSHGILCNVLTHVYIVLCWNQDKHICSHTHLFMVKTLNLFF
jgi:hypothetical protein